MPDLVRLPRELWPDAVDDLVRQLCTTIDATTDWKGVQITLEAGLQPTIDYYYSTGDSGA